MRRLLSLIIGFHLLAAAAVAGPVLIITYSDAHSHYARLPIFIQAVSKLRQEFLARHPDGDVILVNNGDLIGKAARWTMFGNDDIQTDYGKLGLDVQLDLAHVMEVVDGVGNHEEWDWSPGEGQEIFVRQRSEYLRHLNSLKRGRKEPLRLIAANVTLGTWGQKLFAPYVDIPTKDGSFLRFVGGVLDEFWEKTTYDPSDPFEIIRGEGTEGIRPLRETVKAQLQRAAKEGARRVVFALHEEAVNIVPLVGEIDEWLIQQGGALREMRLPLWIGGHNHKPRYQRIGNKNVFQSGSDYDFTAVTLSDSHKIMSVKHFGHDEQQELVATGVTLSPHEQVAYDRARERVADLRAALSLRSVVTTVKGIYTVKEDLKVERQQLGIEVCEMLCSYGRTQKRRFPDIEFVDEVAFFNPSSWKLDYTIPAGNLYSIDFDAIYPFDYRAGVFAVSGKELQILYTEMRASRAKTGVHAPQISHNLREKAGGKDYELEHYIDGEWGPLLHAHYLLTLDGWYSSNKIKLPMWHSILHKNGENKPAVNDTFRDVLEANARYLNCPELLAFSMKHGLVRRETIPPELLPAVADPGEGDVRPVLAPK